MLDEKFMNKYRIASARAQWHDYNGGEYFVTICTKDRVHYFGEIYDGKTLDGANDAKIEPKMYLTEIGKFTDSTIQKISTHNHYAEIPLYVIMPNHIHLIVIIDGGGNCRDVPWREKCCRDVPWREKCSRDVPWRVSTDGKNTTMQDICNRQGKLSTVIGGMKQSITRFARKHNIPFAWQPRFHDHIIRDTNEMNNIADYIENNVAKWQNDKFNV